MCFDVMREKLAAGQYMSWEQFDADLFLIFNNAMVYNPPGTVLRLVTSKCVWKSSHEAIMGSVLMPASCGQHVCKIAEGQRV